MKKQRLLSLIIPLVLISCSLVGCGKENSKVIQCQKMISLSNQASRQVKTLANEQHKKEQDGWLQAANTLEATAKELENLKLSDPTLNQSKQLLVQTYKDYAKATREMLIAMENQNLQSARQAQLLVQRAGKTEAMVGEELNQYCQQ